jgi:cell division protein FtsB
MLTIVLGALALEALWSPSGPRDLLLLRHHSDVMIQERNKLFLDNAALRDRIIRLRSDDAYLQRLIRQQLGYVRSGELVYRFSKTEQP